MGDINVINEVATNQRTVGHPAYGSFIVRRPTHGVLASIEGARTRQLNKDLQARELFEDPTTGETKQVPAYLSRKSRGEELKFHGLWSDKDEADLNVAMDSYRTACMELDKAGYDGTTSLEEQITDLNTQVRKLLGAKAEKLEDELAIVLPSVSAAPASDDPAAMERYGAARSKISAVGSNMDLDEALVEADKLHKRITLYIEGVRAQTALLAARMNELSLFADTLEARADGASRVAKVFYCALTTSKKPIWKSTNELENEPADKITWLFDQIERFERLDETLTEEERRKRERFNFLAPDRPRIVSSDESPEAPQSNEDGESPTVTPTTSSEDSDTK